MPGSRPRPEPKGRRILRSAEGNTLVSRSRPCISSPANECYGSTVAEGLVKRWSPAEVAARLVIDHPDDPEMRVSHETIYTSLYLQGKGGLKRELIAALRSGRLRRRPRRRGENAKRANVLGRSARSVPVRPRPPTGPSPATGRATAAATAPGSPSPGCGCSSTGARARRMVDQWPWTASRTPSKRPAARSCDRIR